MKVPYLDLRVTDFELKHEMLSAIEQVLDHGRILLGPEVAELETRLAEYCGTRYAVCCGSGTDALILATKALDLKPTDEVITSCLSFVGTANGISVGGAKPVFSDVSHDLTIDPECVEKAIGPNTKAIVPVHFTGRIANVDALSVLAERYGLSLIEDAAPAIGASRGNRRAGSFGRLACISINPMKVLNALGEAGVVLTSELEMQERLIALRYNGLVNRETCLDRSINGRIDTVQAAAILPRLKRLDAWLARRREIARFYASKLQNYVVVPTEARDEMPAYYTFSIRTQRRSALKNWLELNGIETKIQHDRIIPQHPAYAESDLSKYPNALKFIDEILCLPIHEKLSNEQVEYVASKVVDFFVT